MALTDATGGSSPMVADDELERAVLESETISGGGSPDDLINVMTQTIAPTLALGTTDVVGDGSSDNRSTGVGLEPEPLAVQRSNEPGDRAGDIINERYQLVRLLGKGGMGTVYMARHTTLPKTFAVKVLNQRYAKRKDIAERFLQEARAVSLISHENVVGVIDFGSEDDGSTYLVMEHLLGESLAAICKRDAPLTWPRIAHIMSQVCRALQAAHDVGIIHRDIKPENVLRVGRHADPDFIKVLDFGLAKMQVSGGLRLTRTGMVLGTPDYMSPEQARGQPTDHRADIYGSGVMMYELLCGRVPFQATTFPAMRQKHLLEPPEPPSKWAPDVGISAEMDAIVLRALAKDPAHRFASMTQMAQAIAGVGSSGAVPVELLERRTMPLLIERNMLDRGVGGRAGPRGSGLPIGPTLPLGGIVPIKPSKPSKPVMPIMPAAASLGSPESSSEAPPRSRAGVVIATILGVIGVAVAAVVVGGQFGFGPLATTPELTPPNTSVRAVVEPDAPKPEKPKPQQPKPQQPKPQQPKPQPAVVDPTPDPVDSDPEIVPERAPDQPDEPAAAPKPKPKPKPKPELKPEPEPEPRPEPEPEPDPDHSFSPEIVDPFGAPKSP